MASDLLLLCELPIRGLVWMLRPEAERASGGTSARLRGPVVPLAMLVAPRFPLFPRWGAVVEWREVRQAVVWYWPRVGLSSVRGLAVPWLVLLQAVESVACLVVL